MKRISHIYFLLLNVGVLSHLVKASHGLDSCPGYNAENVQVTEFALTADLVLAGEPCAVYGEELKKLSLLVEYQTGECWLCVPFRSHILSQTHAYISK